MPYPATVRTFLAAGQALQLPVTGKTEIVCLRGDISLDCGPLWLAERMLHRCFPLTEGESRIAESGERVTIRARQDAEILLLRPRSAPAILLRRLTAAARLLRKAGTAAA